MKNSKDFDCVPDFCREYLGYIRNVENLSPLTTEQYYMDLKLFFCWLAEEFGIVSPDAEIPSDGRWITIDIIKKLTFQDLINYIDFTNSELQNHAKARARKISSLRGFFKYLQKRNLIEDNQTLNLSVPKLPKELPRYLNLNQAKTLLESIDGKNKERKYCIITLFLNCGMRLSELVGINIGDIDFEYQTVLIHGKGNKERSLHINSMCIAALKDYLAIRQAQPHVIAGNEKALFLSRNGKRISNRMVQTMIKTFLDKSGLDTEKYSAHKLRHTAATLMYRNGVDVRVLQEVLGHANLGTTQIYTHVADSQIEYAIENNPLDTMKINKKNKK